MPLAMQAKMLRFLEHRKFMRVGGSMKIDADLRLVFATLRPLDDDVRIGALSRGPLLSRAGHHVACATTSRRKADIPQLGRILHRATLVASRHASRLASYRRMLRNLLSSYSWPGNARELRNVLRSVPLRRQDVADLLLLA